jgi:hypothetical protein
VQSGTRLQGAKIDSVGLTQDRTGHALGMSDCAGDKDCQWLAARLSNEGTSNAQQ